MAASIIVFPWGQYELGRNLVDWVGDTVTVILLQNSYAYDKTDRFVADLTPATHEHDGVGYARVAVSGKSSSLRADNEGLKYDSNDVIFSSLAAGSLPIRHAAFYRDVASDADHKLLLIVDFGADQTPTAVDFQIQTPTNGWMETENRKGADAVTTVDDDSASGQKVLAVAATTNMIVGGRVAIDPFDKGSRLESGVIDTISAGVSITLLANLTFEHTAAQADVVHVENV